MLLDNTLFDELTAQARLNPRLRQHYDLRDSADDTSMRMLNALEPGTVIPVHRHTTSEDVVCLRGAVEEVLFDDAGEEVQRFRLVAGSEVIAVHVPMGVYHTCQSLMSGSVILEFKNGKYDPETTEEVMGR